MKVEQVFSDKKRFLDLLLLADEQEDMVDRYLERDQRGGRYLRTEEYRDLSGEPAQGLRQISG